MFPLLCFLTGIGCASTSTPPVEEPTPGHPIVAVSAAEATDREAERLRAQADAVQKESDAQVEQRRLRELSDRETAIRAHRRREETRRNGPSRPGFWNPAKGERPPDRVVPPPARQCRTVAATETQGRVYSVRQADGSRTVGVEPVPGEVLPLEICDPPSPDHPRSR